MPQDSYNFTIAAAPLPPPTVPAAPTGLVAVALSTGSIRLSWIDNAINETGYKIERGPNTGSFTQIASVGTNAFTYSDGSLSNGATYYYRVRATNAAGDSVYSNSAFAVTQPVTINAPSSLALTVLSTGSIALSWTDNSNNESGFKLERSVNLSDFTQIGLTGPNATTFMDGSLSYGTTYYYRVKAYNSLTDSPYSNFAVGTTRISPVNAPTNLVAVAQTSGSIVLNWVDNAANEDGFRIERGFDQNSFTQIAGPAANSISFTDTGLNYGTTYYYRVKAYNSLADSSYSNSAIAATLPYVLGAPTNLSATAISRTSIQLSWKDNATDETGFVLERMQNTQTGYVQRAVLQPNTIAFTDSGLYPGTRYTYRLKAYNSIAASGYSNEAAAETRYSRWRSPEEGEIAFGECCGGRHEGGRPAGKQGNP